MATKYLDNSGLAYFWGKIKSYIAGLLSSKADDSAVMHIAGTETVSGLKTFTNKLLVSGDHYSSGSGLVLTGGRQNYAIAIQTDRVTKGTAPSTTVYNGIEFYGTAMTKYQDRLAMIEHYVSTGNLNSIFLRAYNLTSAENTATCTISCNVDASGNAYTAAPTPAIADNSTKIATTAWVRTATGNTALNAATASAVAWSGVTNKPTTLSGYGITDAKIANGTITLGSNSITPLTSVPSHNQASNTINAMTGYSKPSSTSAIASTDSLNTAVGKLEKEDEYLHDEFLLVKGVADNCYAVATAHQQLIEDLQDDVDAKASATHTHGSITNDGKLGTASRAVVTDGSKVIAVSSVTATELGYLSGVTSAVQTQLNAKVADSAVVHLAGAETVTGDKIFSGELIRKETASGTAAFFNSHRETATGAWSCGIGVGGTGKGGFYDWTRGKYFFSRALTTGDIEIIAYPDSGSPAKSFILKSDGTATWNGQAIQTSSDERLKTPLAAVPDEVLDAWGDVGWGQFQFLSAIDCKGESARLHLGLIAQRVKSAFEARGLDACAYGILCHDERPEREATGEDGRPTIEEAVDLWTVRYAEALAMEAAYQRRRADRLEARIAALEVKIDA